LLGLTWGLTAASLNLQAQEQRQILRGGEALLPIS
jgi:hypothetical protein